MTKRSQPEFMKQWASTGRLNGHIEEVFTGHEVVKVFGRQQEAREEFDTRNDAVFAASFKAQFISGVIQPVMMFVVQHQLRARGRHRWPAGRVGHPQHR